MMTHLRFGPHLFLALAAVLCGIAPASRAVAAELALPTTLDQLLQPNASISINGIVFSDFTFAGAGIGVPPPTQININTDAGGVVMTAPFFDLPDAAVSDAFLTFQVTGTNITRMVLSGNPSLGSTGEGFASVSQLVSDTGLSAETDQLQLTITHTRADAMETLKTNDFTSFTAPIQQPFSVTTDIAIFSAGPGATNSATLSTIKFGFLSQLGVDINNPIQPIPSDGGGGGLAFEGFDCASSYCLAATLDSRGLGIDYPMYFDPPAAIGFDYEVASGPAMSAIVLPPAGDDTFEVLGFDLTSGNYVSLGTALTGVRFDLRTGYSKLRVLGIEESANVDSEDPLAFPTGIIFSSGTANVALVMTPIAVPEPMSDVLLISTLCGLFACRRRR